MVTQLLSLAVYLSTQIEGSWTRSYACVPFLVLSISFYLKGTRTSLNSSVCVQAVFVCSGADSLVTRVNLQVFHLF